MNRFIEVMNVLSVFFLIVLGSIGLLAILPAATPHGTMYEETPLGVLDGNNAIFTIQHQPAPWSAIKLYRNGMRLKRAVFPQGLGDYVLDTTVFNSTKIVFQPACIPSCIPQPGDTLLADYTY